MELQVHMEKILIADDNIQITGIIAEFVKKQGFEPVIAYDGRQALDFFHKDTFAMALLDVMMPYMDGFALCREIRRTSNVPIIMITARGEDFERVMGLDIGADDYIVKPFSGEEVMARRPLPPRKTSLRTTCPVQIWFPSSSLPTL